MSKKEKKSNGSGSIFLLIVVCLCIVFGCKIINNRRNAPYIKYEKTMVEGAKEYVKKHGYQKNNIMLSSLLSGKYVDSFISPKENETCDNSYVKVTKNDNNDKEYSYQACLICSNYQSSNCK